MLRLGALMQDGLPGVMPAKSNTYYKACMIAKNKAAILHDLKVPNIHKMLRDEAEALEDAPENALAALGPIPAPT